MYDIRRNDIELRILSLNHLEYCRKRRYAVYSKTHRAWQKPHPAAFIINLPGIILYRLIEDGLYTYNKNAHKENTNAKEKE